MCEATEERKKEGQYREGRRLSCNPFAGTHHINMTSTCFSYWCATACWGVLGPRRMSRKEASGIPWSRSRYRQKVWQWSGGSWDGSRVECTLKRQCGRVHRERTVAWREWSGEALETGATGYAVSCLRIMSRITAYYQEWTSSCRQVSRSACCLGRECSCWGL